MHAYIHAYIHAARTHTQALAHAVVHASEQWKNSIFERSHHYKCTRGALRVIAYVCWREGGVYVSNVELEIYSRLPVNPADMADVQAGAQEFDPEFFGSSC